jgi:D-serine deaminase-like pyridoxal phosphate-dependent protein
MVTARSEPDAGRDRLPALAEVAGLETQPTPFLAVDLDTVGENIRRLEGAFAGRPQRLRPHAKTHKCSALARLQVAAGAIGMTCSTSDEVAALAAAGIESLVLANVVTDPTRLQTLAAIAGTCDLTLVVDSGVTARLASDAAREAGTMLGFLVELDIGMRRNGVQTVGEAIELVEQSVDLPGLRFEGVQAYEGHLIDIVERRERRAAVLASFAPAVELIHALEDRGYASPRLTGSSSATYDASGFLPEMREVQAGTYVLMDATYRELTPEFVPALAVVCSVTSSRANGEIVVDVGTKRLAFDWGVPAWPGGAAEYVGNSEEHMQFRHVSGPAPAVGQRIALTPAHACSTMSMYRLAFGCRDGRLVDELVTDGRDPLA